MNPKRAYIENLYIYATFYLLDHELKKTEHSDVGPPKLQRAVRQQPCFVKFATSTFRSVLMFSSHIKLYIYLRQIRLNFILGKFSRESIRFHQGTLVFAVLLIDFKSNGNSFQGHFIFICQSAIFVLDLLYILHTRLYRPFSN